MLQALDPHNKTTRGATPGKTIANPRAMVCCHRKLPVASFRWQAAGLGGGRCYQKGINVPQPTRESAFVPCERGHASRYSKSQRSPTIPAKAKPAGPLFNLRRGWQLPIGPVSFERIVDAGESSEVNIGSRIPERRAGLGTDQPGDVLARMGSSLCWRFVGARKALGSSPRKPTAHPPNASPPPPQVRPSRELWADAKVGTQKRANSRGP